MVIWSSTRWVDDINAFWVHSSDLSACVLRHFRATVVPALKKCIARVQNVK